MMTVLSTLHAALFGYETALVELIGPRGYKTHVFPKIMETIRKIKDEDPLIADLFNAKTPKEAMEKWMKVLELAGVVKGGSIIKLADDEYEIKIPHCAMCNPIHEIVGDQKGICPMALILASASSVAKIEKVPEMTYSEFMPTGTITNLKFVEG